LSKGSQDPSHPKSAKSATENDRKHLAGLRERRAEAIVTSHTIISHHSSQFLARTTVLSRTAA
jgi:hypothetical protein